MRQDISKIEKERLYKQVIPVASRLRRAFISDSEIIKDTFKIIEEQLGYLLIRFPAPNGNCEISGFHIKKGNTNCIYINTNQNLGRQYFSAWHEFYHAETGDGTGMSYIKGADKDPSEYKADVTAGYILMPDELVKTYFMENNIIFPYISYKQIIEIQNHFKLGYSATVQRLIQIFPEEKETLSKRFALGKESSRLRMKQIVEEVGGNMQLITPTKDIYIPETFFKDLEYNMAQKRVSTENAFNILKYIERLGNSGEQ